VFNEEGLDDSVCIPLRLIETRDEDVIEAIIHATNNQSLLKPEQLYALMKFSKKLEEYFQTYKAPNTLYYERRDGQYDRIGIEKTRIIVPANVIRAFAAMFLNEPHRTTRSYKALREKVGEDIFSDDHKLEPYYAAAYGLYRLEWLFRNDARFASKYKPARYHVLLAARLLVNPADLPPLNSNEVERRANELITAFWRDDSDELFLNAIEVVDKVAASNMERDHIRQKPITDALLQHFGLRPRAE
jgi:AIPR protein